MKTLCQIKDIYKALYEYEKQFQKLNGVTLTEAMVLCCLRAKAEKQAKNICEFVGLSNSRVSRVIASVEKAGYIKRKMGKDDKRQSIFSLSAKGLKKIEAMEKNDISLNNFLKLTRLKK